MDFARSARSTLGIEWELQLVDPASRELVGEASELIRRAADPRIKGEFFTNTIEVVTGVHATTRDAVAEARELRDTVLRIADAMGLRVIGAGTHPFSRWREQEVASLARYQRLVERVGPWSLRQIILGVHNHVGIEQRDKVLPIADYLVAQLPLVLALSASSPFWQGEDSGCVSQRSMLFQQLPNAGLPPQFANWDAYARAVEQLTELGSIEAPNELRWDVRPSAGLGTVEARIADGAVSLDDVAAVTALTHCLTEEASRVLDRGEQLPSLPAWLLRENKWRATRDGMDAEIVAPMAYAAAPLTTLSARTGLIEAAERLEPIAADLGAREGLDALRRVVARGSSALTQRAAFAAGGEIAVVDRLISDLAHDA